MEVLSKGQTLISQSSAALMVSLMVLVLERVLFANGQSFSSSSSRWYCKVTGFAAVPGVRGVGGFRIMRASLVTIR